MEIEVDDAWMTTCSSSESRTFRGHRSHTWPSRGRATMISTNAKTHITPPTDRGQHTASNRPVPMPTNERLKPSSSVTKMGSLVAPKRIIDCVASVALTMKRHLSLTQVDSKCTGSKKAREADVLPGANADWSSPDPQVDSPLITSNSLLSLALADSKHRRGMGHPHKQGSATTVFATGTLSAPQANETTTSTYIILGAPSSSSAIHEQQTLEKEMISPTDTVRKIFQSSSSSSSQIEEKAPITENTDYMYTDFFTKPTEEQIAAYDAQKITAVRNGDIVTLRSLLEAGQNLSCCNKFGESLIHMACRRGHIDVVRFLLQDAKVSLTVRDDYGRTPFHDCCWRPSPSYDLMELLLREGDPRLLLLKDVRGHTPFDYSGAQWAGWNEFLESRKDLLLSRLAEVTPTSNSDEPPAAPSAT